MTRYNVGDRVLINMDSTTCEAVVVLDKLDLSVLVVVLGETFAVNRCDIIGYAEPLK